MKTAQVCPVCNGRGQVNSRFYNTTLQATSAETLVTCRTCEGKGIVWPPDSDTESDGRKGGCSSCSNNDGITYCSNPVRYKCTIDNRYHYGNYSCKEYSR